MSKITYQTILRLINSINTFAEQSDKNIKLLRNNFDASKRRLEEQYDNFTASAKAEYERNIAAVKKKAATLKDNAEKVYKNVMALDAALIPLIPIKN